MDIMIRSLRTTHHKAPAFTLPLHDSTLGPFERFSPSVLRVHIDGGREGISLTTPLESEIIRQVLAPVVLGHPLTAWPTLRQRAFWAIRNLGHAGMAMNALSSLDVAIHDLLGQMENVPLWRQAGGEHRRMEAYGSGGWTNLSRDVLVQSMVDLVHRGFRTVKMKVGVDFGLRPAEDIERVRLVRDAIGPDVGLAVDANQCWDAATGLRVAGEIAELNIAWFEEPVFACDRQAAAVFRRESPIALASGESERLALGFRDLIGLQAVDIVQPQPLVCGGVTGWREAAALATAANLPINAGGPSFLTCQLLAAVPGAGPCEYLEPFMDTLSNYFRHKPRLENGHLVMDDLPGNGLQLDEEYLRLHPGAAGWERVA